MLGSFLASIDLEEKSIAAKNKSKKQTSDNRHMSLP